MNRDCSKLETKSNVKVLVTGFEPYSGYKENPSKRIVEALRNYRYKQRVRLFTKILPVSFERTRKRVKTLIKTLKPDLVLMLGFSPKSTRFEIEKNSVNMNSSSSRRNVVLLDNDNHRVYGEISKKGPRNYKTTFPIPVLLKAFKTFDVPVKVSDKIGTFVCNLALYAALEEINYLDLPTKVAFIHVPPLDNVGLGKPIKVMRHILCTFNNSK